MMKLDDSTFYRIPAHLQIAGYTHALPRQMTPSQYTAIVEGTPEPMPDVVYRSATFDADREKAKEEYRDEIRKGYDKDLAELYAARMRDVFNGR